MTLSNERLPLKWSTQLNVLPSSSTPSLRGDKIILPPSALEALLAAATVTVTSAYQPQTSAFDPYNPYSFAAERQAREQLVERQQQLPHPLTFRLVNPENGRMVFAGIREFSAQDETVGLSSFLRESLGFGTSDSGNGIIKSNGNNTLNEIDSVVTDSSPSRLTIHAQELPKGTFVKLRPLEAGYDPEDWKALLEQYLRDNYTTLTFGEVLAIPAGKEIFRFLVDGLKPNANAISIIDTDLEVDIEPLNEEQARETLKRLVEKSKTAPGTSEGSSAGGKILVDRVEVGQVRPGDYVDYTIETWERSQHLDVELTAFDSEQDIDVFVTPYGSRHRGRPREDEYVFGNITTNASKRVKIRHTNTELENAEAIWVSVRGCAERSGTTKTYTPIQYSLQISSTSDDSTIPDDNLPPTHNGTLSPDEERCTNCHQPVPKRTLFLHQNFCLRNNISCPHCHITFLKTSFEWQNHWHCPDDIAHGSSPSSKQKHDSLFHTSHACPSCAYLASNMPSLAHHRTSTCPGKLILCQFCHLQVQQQGPDDPPSDSAEVIMSGLTPHELSDGARTTECHICAKIVRLRDMPTHLKFHDHQRLSRQKPRICRNANCGRTLDGIGKNGEIRVQGPRNDLGVCDACFGPLYVSMYDQDGKALKRRVERKYLTQLLTGCGQSWCRNKFCKSGRKALGLLGEGQAISSKEALGMIRPSLEDLQNMSSPVLLCVDEASQKRRRLAEMMAAERGTVMNGVGSARDDSAAGEEAKGKGKQKEESVSGWDLVWCIAALEVAAGDLDKGRQWLRDFAPTRAEAAR